MIKQFFNKLPRKPAKLGESSDLDSELDAESLPGLNSTSNSLLNHASRIPQALNLKLNVNSTISVYEALPSFRDVATSEKQALFLKKLNLCCVVFDFNDSKCYLKEKDIKRLTLLELIDFFASAKEKLTETIMQELVKMVSINLFTARTPPPRENKVLEDNDLEEELSLDPSWPHMQLVYELLLRFLVSPETDAKLAKHCIDHPFILRLLDFFDSKDPREREYLKTILHRLYGKFMVHRPFIREAIGNVFYRFIFETKKHNGIGELLAILGSIINGFALPLQEQHKLFLFQYLIPLHKLICLSLYHAELSYCIAQYVEKDCKLVDAVVMGLLEYWPIANSSMEVLFLVELEMVWGVTQEFQSCVVPLFCQIATCISSSDFEVAETALLLWNDDHVVNLLQKNRKDIFPIILPVLEKKARESLDPRIESLTLGLQKMFSDMDAELFDECFVKFAGR